ncbi:tetraspanin-9-like [Lethenteron reissneri]|uniref:tetraspanin-9-like n=1 Tax=Lethenteron reissneri TaxID=7753 RepID=UPI002AB7ABF7|nr:tetraspanin-9-like [Lethenteron reissneri]
MGVSKLTIATLLLGLGLAVCACALVGVGACLPVHSSVLETLLGSKILMSGNSSDILGSTSKLPASGSLGSGWLTSESLGLGARVACLGGAALLSLIALLLVVAAWYQLWPLLILFMAIAVILSLSAIVAAQYFIPDTELIAWIRARGSKLLRHEFESNLVLASAWNHAMSEFQCCGVSSALDFDTIPKACCGPHLNSTCQPYPQGCLDKYIDILQDHKRVFIQVAIISTLMLAVAVVMCSLQLYKLSKEMTKSPRDVYVSSEDVAPLL